MDDADLQERRKGTRRAKLSNTVVRRLRHEGPSRQTVVWDDKQGPHYIRGFYVVCYPSGICTYFIRVPDKTSRSRYRHVRLGGRDEISCDEAREKALHVLQDARLNKRGRPGPTQKIPCREAVERFRKEYRTRGKGRPIEDHPNWRANLNRLIEAYGHLPMEQIGIHDLQMLVESLSWATAHHCRSNFAVLWDYITADGWIPHAPNPARRIVVSGCKKTFGKRKRAITQAELEAAIEAVSDDRVFALYIQVLALTGHRPGELMRARWEDVKDGRVCVRETKRNRPITLPPVPSKELAAVLKQLRKETGDFDGLFSDDVSIEAASKRYKALACRWKSLTDGHEILSGVKLSHFRSTAATAAYREAHAKAIAEAQERLQHRDPSVTEQSYVVTDE